MSNFFKNDLISLDFRVCRAILTPENVKKQYGILANFSAKTILTAAGQETELMVHNSLMLTVKEHHLSITSHNKQDTWKDKAGNEVIGPKVYYTNIFPKAKYSERNIHFVQDLAEEIRDFAVKAKAAWEKKQNNNFEEQLELF